MWGMKQILLMIAVVGCGTTPDKKPLIADPIVERAIRDSYLVKKPTGELTKSDLEKVTRLDVRENQLTDVKGLEKLTQFGNAFFSSAI